MSTKHAIYTVYQYINILTGYPETERILKQKQKRLSKDATHVQPLNSQGSAPILGAADGAHQPQAVEPCQGLEWIGCFRPLVAAINQIFFMFSVLPKYFYSNMGAINYNHYSRCAFFNLNWWTWEDNNTSTSAQIETVEMTTIPHLQTCHVMIFSDETGCDDDASHPHHHDRAKT